MDTAWPGSATLFYCHSKRTKSTNFGSQLLNFKVVRTKFVASAAKEKRSSSIDELKVRRHCHRSSVTAVDGSVRLYASRRVAEGDGRVHIPLVSLMFKNRHSLRTDAPFGITELFISPEEAADVVTFETRHKDALWSCVCASYPSCKLRSQFRKLTDSTAQWSKAFIIMSWLRIQETSRIPLVCNCDTQTEMPSVMSKCCDYSAIVAAWALVSELTRILCHISTHHSCRLVTVH